MQAEIKKEKQKKRRASRALLAEKRPAWQKICFQPQRNWQTLMTWFQTNGSLQWIFFVA
jgi:hypothetical protein